MRRLNALFQKDRGASNGLIIALLIIVGLAVVAAPFFLSVAPAVEQSGRVTALGSVKKGWSPSVVVMIEGKRVWLPIGGRLDCAPGDEIQIYRHTTALGLHRYKVGPRGCVNPEDRHGA